MSPKGLQVWQREMIRFEFIVSCNHLRCGTNSLVVNMPMPRYIQESRITQNSDHSNLNFEKWEKNLLLILSYLHTNTFRRNIFLAHIHENSTYLSVHMTLIHIFQLHLVMLSNVMIWILHVKIFREQIMNSIP